MAKVRPKVGDRVEFKFGRGALIGEIIAVAETGTHYLIKMPRPKYARKRIRRSRIIRILPPEVE